MKNADKPINPIEKSPVSYEGKVGLTKREYFAAKAMQGLWSSDNEFEMEPKSVAQLAIESADELLKQLDQ
jgi:hypothetical protein